MFLVGAWMPSRSGQAGTYVFYATLTLIVAGSVAFGLDWVNAPLPPMPETEASVQAAKLAAHVPPLRAVQIANVRSVYPARPLPPGSNPNTTAMVEPQIGQPAPEQAAPVAAADQTQPKCDVAACSAAYHSFRAIDCTWQPFDGPRRLCDKGQPQPQTDASAVTTTPGGSIAAPEANAAQPTVTPAPPNCHVDACKQAYFTFNVSDCTYQPSNGPRKLCTK